MAGPDLNNRLDKLTENTRQGRTEANALKRRAATSRYQADRLVEGVDRLDHTLDSYRKRMDDVEQAVQGIYALEPHGSPDENEENGEADESGDLEREKSPVRDEAVPRTSTWKENSWLSWIPALTG